ncbi:MAG: hypothetical protein OEV15_04780 [Gallionella sp.]|nr:hypothetical protein [Gallionella sp.]
MNIKQGKWLFAVLAVAMASMALADPAQDTELAEKEYKSDNLIRALELFGNAAMQGYAPAQVRYAELLDYAEEDEKSVFWYQIAVEQGSAAAEMGLGMMYLKGDGVKQDAEKSLYWIRHSAEQSYLPAVEYLVNYYRGEAKKWEDAAKFLKEKAAAEKAAIEKAAAEKAAVEKAAAEKAAKQPGQQ